MAAKHKMEMHHRAHKKRGGKTGEPEVGGEGKTAKTKPHEYNAQGSEEAKEVHDEKESFNKGGHARKHKAKGGHAEGEKPHHRLDRKHRASGGRSKGRSPFTDAHALKGPENSKDGQGHEGAGPKGYELED